MKTEVMFCTDSRNSYKYTQCTFPTDFSFIYMKQTACILRKRYTGLSTIEQCIDNSCVVLKDKQYVKQKYKTIIINKLTKKLINHRRCKCFVSISEPACFKF